MKQIPDKTKIVLDAIDRISDVRALVIGDIMLDVYEFCRTEESKPIDSEKPGKRAYKAQETIKVLGGAGNVAANLASLGVHTSLVGMTGSDEHYFKLRELAAKQQIRHFLIRDGARPTTTKVRLYLDDEYLLRRDSESIDKIDNETSATLVNEALRELPEIDVVVLSDYNKGVFTEANGQQIIKECRMHAIPVIVDCKPPNRAAFVGADIIAPNYAEAAMMVSGFSLETLESGCRQLGELLQCLNIVVTLGVNGVCGCSADGFFRIAGNRVEAVDEVGCGDTVRAGLAIGIALGLSLQQAAELANDAAAVIVQKPATALMKLQELRDLMIETFKRATRKDTAPEEGQLTLNLKRPCGSI